MKKIDKLKSLIENLKKKREENKQLEFENTREYYIKMLNHPWSDEEWGIYNHNYTVAQECWDGLLPASTYQEMILKEASSFLKPEEIEEFKNAIKERKHEEANKHFLYEQRKKYLYGLWS